MFVAKILLRADEYDPADRRYEEKLFGGKGSSNRSSWLHGEEVERLGGARRENVFLRLREVRRAHRKTKLNVKSGVHLVSVLSVGQSILLCLGYIF